MVNVGQDFKVWRVALFVHDSREQQANLFSALLEIIKILRAQWQDFDGPLFTEQSVHPDHAVEFFLVLCQRIQKCREILCSPRQQLDRFFRDLNAFLHYKVSSFAAYLHRLSLLSRALSGA